MKRRLVAMVPVLALAAACRGEDHCDDGHVDEECPAEEMAHTVFVARDGSLTSYELGTGEERAGRVDDVYGASDMQVLADGHVLVNLTERDEILVVDGYTMEVVTRVPSSNVRARDPVRSLLTPDRRLWLSLNDRNGGSAAFVDLRNGSDDRFRLVGEIDLGAGHHEAAFSRTRPRVIISNQTDCDDLLVIYAYGDLDDIQEVATLGPRGAGLDGNDPGEGDFDPTYCDETGVRGSQPGVRECAIAPNGHAFCNMASTGDIVAVNLDEDEPTFELLETAGTGGGAMRLHPGERYVYGLQHEPRQLVVVDSRTDSVVAEVPLCDEGSDCGDDQTVWDDDYAGELTFALDGDTLYAGPAYETDRLLVIDVSDPANPEPREALRVGLGIAAPHALSGDGALLVHVDTEVGTLSLVDVPSRERLGTIDVGPAPAAVGTFGSAEGPSR